MHIVLGHILFVLFFKELDITWMIYIECIFDRAVHKRPALLHATISYWSLRRWTNRVVINTTSLTLFLCPQVFTATTANTNTTPCTSEKRFLMFEKGRQAVYVDSAIWGSFWENSIWRSRIHCRVVVKSYKVTSHPYPC